MNNHFIVIVPFYNVSKWIQYNIASIMKQTYVNFDCYLIDDLSTDNTCELIDNMIVGDNRFHLIKNKIKKLALRNIFDAIEFANTNPEDIIVTLDGDDWLYSKDVLEHLNNVYNEKDCWLTYGSYAEFPSGNRGKFARQIPQQIVEQKLFRKAPWCSSHLRTFKHHLWKKIKHKDLLDTDGNFYKMTWDLSFMFPMLEMANTRSFFIEKLLYVYNLDNPYNDHKVDNSYQLKLEAEIRNKEVYDTVINK